MRAAKTIAFAFGMASLAVGAVAEPVALSGTGLRTAVSGKTVLIATPVGTLPIVYRSNGTMTARSRILAGYSGPQADTGVWWVSNDRLCQRWQSWLDGKSHCYRMQMSGTTVHWSRDDGRSGTATIAN